MNEMQGTAPRRFTPLRRALALLLVLSLGPAAADARPAGPPNGIWRELPAPELFDGCYPEAARAAGIEGELVLRVAVAASGEPRGHAVESSSAGALQAAADCLAAKLRLVPTAEGPSHTLVFGFSLQPVAGSDARRPQVVSIEPPQVISRNRRAIEHCYVRLAYSHGPQLRSEMWITVGTDGAVRMVSVPAGSEPWVQALAECIASRMKFSPGRRQGRLVESIAALPMRLKIS